MNTEFFGFDTICLSGDSATHPLARPCARLSFYPQGAGRIRKAAKAAVTPLSRRVANPGLLPRCFVSDKLGRSIVRVQLRFPG